MVIAIRIDPIFYYFGSDPTVQYDSASGDLIPAGGSMPDPLALVPVSLFLLEDPNNQPTPNTFFETVGLSIALEFDPLEIDPQTVEQGADLASMNSGAGPDFWGPQISGNVITIGVLYSTVINMGQFEETLIADVDRELAVLQIAPATGFLTGNNAGVTVNLPFNNPAGPTGVQNEVVIDGATGVLPVTTPVTITFQAQ